MINKHKLRELVEQVAEIKDITPKSTPDVRYPEIDDNQIVINGEEIILGRKFNPTLGFELVKIKEVERLCELGCGKIVPNQTIQKRMYVNPIRHWRTRCDTCGLWQKPKKDGFIESRSVQNEYVVYFNEQRTKDK